MTALVTLKLDHSPRNRAAARRSGLQEIQVQSAWRVEQDARLPRPFGSRSLMAKDSHVTAGGKCWWGDNLFRILCVIWLFILVLAVIMTAASYHDAIVILLPKRHP